MTKTRAVQHAQYLAKKNSREYFVIWSVEDEDRDGEHYHVCTEPDLQGYYVGCATVAVSAPDGLIEWN